MRILKFILAILAFTFFIVSCKESDIDTKSETQLSKNKKSRTTSVGCGSYLNGQHGSNGYYNYGNYTIDLTNYKVGTVITIYCQSIEVPNRFNVEGSGGLSSTGWIGWSSSYGPWGSSLNGPGSATLTITKQSASDNYFTFSVETVVQGQISDAWEASIGCSHPSGCCLCTCP